MIPGVERDPGDMKPSGEGTTLPDDEDARIDALLASLPPAPGIEQVDDDDDDDWAEAEADIAAGRGVPHAEVSKWLKTWGTPDFKPMPDEWLK